MTENEILEGFQLLHVAGKFDEPLSGIYGYARRYRKATLLKATPIKVSVSAVIQEKSEKRRKKSSVRKSKTSVE